MTAALPGVTLRAATVADCIAAAEVNIRAWQQSFADRPPLVAGDASVERRADLFRRRFDAPLYRMYVAEAQGQGVVGFVDVGPPREPGWHCDAELYAIYVLKPYQRTGVGSRLFELAWGAVLAAGLRSMYLIVLQDSPYRAFYERAGGRLLAQRAAGALPGQDAHAIYAWLDLRGRIGRDPGVAALLALFDEGAAPGHTIELDDSGWREFGAFAFRHCVAPQAWDRLRRSGCGRSAPAWALHGLERSYVRTGLDNLRLYGRVAPVLHRLAAEGIEVIVLKGAYLAAAVYAERALRSMADVDLLVRRDDLARTATVLCELGWSWPGAKAATGEAGVHPPAGMPAAPPPTATVAAVATPRDDHHLPPFVLAGVHIEVHWHIEPACSPFDIDIDDLWRRARPATIAGAAARALAPEDLLLHLCLHVSYNHGWLPFRDGLRPLRDIAACAAHPTLRPDWDTLVQRALDWRAGHCVWLTLSLARDLAGAQVPVEAIARLALGGSSVRQFDCAIELMLAGHYDAVERTIPALGRLWFRKVWQELPPVARWRIALWPGQESLLRLYPRLAGRRLAPLRRTVYWLRLGADALRATLLPVGHRLRAEDRRRVELARWLAAPRLSR
jgi:ribosomal protein S18 acetylase RimI-like enzyme